MEKTVSVISETDNLSLPVDEDADRRPAFVESRDVGAIIRTITKDSVANPREIKRTINLARFYLALRTARRREDVSWIAPSTEQYARWIALTIRWPDMMRWLQWGADEARWNSSGVHDSLVVRRLRKLEDIAEQADNLESWKNLLKSDLSIDAETDCDWSCDRKLFEFFKKESEFSNPMKISNAAQRGFW